VHSQPENARSGVNAPDSLHDPKPRGGETSRAKPEPASAADAVEIALAVALTEATAAHRWEVVVQLARELEARRLAHAANVIILDPRRRRDGGGQ
jgi:hypothetical protein